MTAMITVTGIVGMNPELTEFKDKKKVRFSVASGSRKNNENVTDWYTVEAWNDSTDAVMERIQKGQRVEVTGRFRPSLYESKKYNDTRLDLHITLESCQIIPKESQSEVVIVELSPQKESIA